MDGVICENTKPYRKAKPIPGAIEQLKEWHEKGFKIIIHTSRFQCDRKLTESWLKRHDVKYSKLIMGKPRADIYIDDKGWRFRSWKELSCFPVD